MADGGTQFNTPIININGNPFNGVQPPDTVGDVGVDHYVQATNHPDGTEVRMTLELDVTPPIVRAVELGVRIDPVWR